ncbi:MAG: RepB family DNA primase [Anaerolineae bacterium]|nr:RepB family DNA primase [Anaerolineae bacterium]
MTRPDFTRMAVERQVHAMGCDTFEIGMFNPAYQDKQTGEIGERMELRTWSKETLLKDEAIAHLKLKNMKGCNIYIRPAGEHGLTLVDDLKASTIEQMKKAGFQPAVVVETSPNNYQAWLKHGQTLPKDVSTAAARLCAEKFEGDLGSADWRHFGRLAGFTNRKLKYQMDSGHFPFVKLREHSGQQYDQRKELIQQAEGVIARQRAIEQQRREAWQNRQATVDRQGVKGIDDFRGDPRYGGDNTRVDLAYATYAVARGVPLHEIEAALASRDLSHKGTPRRQQEYIDRTIRKATEKARGGVGR